MESKPLGHRVSNDVTASGQSAQELLRQESVWSELAERMKRGDQAALAELYDGTSALLYGIVLKILGEAETAQEALLDAYTRIWDRIFTFDPAKSGLLAWLILTARSVAIERQDRKPPVHIGPPEAQDRQVLERAFFEGQIEPEFRGAIERLRQQRQKGAGA
jgi:DNA-directed RNA polymerase specialized sigma24 family protein